MSGQVVAGAPTSGAGNSLYRLSWPLLVAAAAFILALRSDLLNDGDTYWHLATAQWIFDHAAIPDADPFSHSRRGSPWLAHEWLAEVVLGLAYRLAGWAGPVGVAAAAFATALALLCRILLGRLEAIYALAFVALAGSLAAPHLLARPHVLVLPLLVAWTAKLLDAGAAGRPPAWPWALLMLLWANMHGSFVLGLALALFFALESLLAAPKPERRRQARAWAAFLLPALVAALATPHGWSGLGFAASVNGMTHTLNIIDEWRSPDFHRLQPLEIWLLVGAAAVLMRGLRLPAGRLALLLGLLHLALAHVRHAEILGLLAPLLLAEPIAGQWRCRPPAGPAGIDAWFSRRAAPAHPATAVAVCLALAGMVWAAASSGGLRPAPSMTPEAALRAVRAAAPKGEVLNAYEFGGYLIFSGISPFIDGRADLYGDSFVADYFEAVRLEKPERLIGYLDRYGIGWTIFQPGTPVVALLDHLPGWRRLFSDRTAVVHVRSPDG